MMSFEKWGSDKVAISVLLLAIIMLIITFLFSGCIATEGWKERVDTEVTNPYPTATKVDPFSLNLQQVGNIGIHDLYEYRSSEIICLIAKESVGMESSISLSCVSK